MNLTGKAGYRVNIGSSNKARSRWILDESKFLSTGEAKKLLITAKNRTQRSHGPAERQCIREYLIIHLVLYTGLRVSEVANLKCGDIYLDGSRSSLIVRNGKGGQARVVALGKSIKRHLVQYLKWKGDIGEPVSEDSPLLLSRTTGGSLTVRAIQKAFKRCAARAGLSPYYSIHSLRHTYACHLYKASGWNLRLVQKQLGHKNISTTQIYADVMEPDLRRALERLYR